MTRESWFDSLTTVGLLKHHSWLANLPSRVERIANFGCWSGSEPFALMWILDATEVMVVEIEEKFIGELREQIEIVSHRYPESLQGRAINYVCRDMTGALPKLPDRHFDLAYCEDVLYTLPIQRDSGALERGILQMIRVVKPNGFVIAVEPKFGAEFQTQKSEILGIDISLPVPITEPKDMSDLFSSKGLRKLEIPGCPPYTYCYQKGEE
jgi:SAM-dependent methyltransferase